MPPQRTTLPGTRWRSRPVCGRTGSPAIPTRRCLNRRARSRSGSHRAGSIPTLRRSRSAAGKVPSPPARTTPSAISPRDEAQDLAFAACMRTHGVPSFPDPDHDGDFTLPSGVDQQAPQFQRATKACANVEPSSLSILNQPRVPPERTAARTTNPPPGVARTLSPRSGIRATMGERVQQHAVARRAQSGHRQRTPAPRKLWRCSSSAAGNSPRLGSRRSTTECR